MAELKHSVVSPEVTFNLEPNIFVGNDKFFKEVKSCGDWCDLSTCCCPYVKFSGKDKSIVLTHKCCCLPCCCPFEASSLEPGAGKKPKVVGTLQPAGCFDQNCTAVFCPCCYTGPKMQAKFVGTDGDIKYMLKSHIKCCQYLCVCLAFCSPCFRCVRFCCTDTQYTKYEQNVYGNDLNDETVYAKVIYTDRMICPCIPDERVQIRIEPLEGKTISEEDLILLSSFPTLISGYTTCEFALPLGLPGGYLSALPTPCGIAQVDDANNIQSQHLTIQESLQSRRAEDMF